MGKGLLGWIARWAGWVSLTVFVTLGGGAALMLFKDWTLKSLFASMMVWPLLGLATLAGMVIALLPAGRVYVLTAIGGGMLYNLILLMA
jgi:hypothetical protein